jgi:multimeric flavodoxin WrbA
VLKDDYEKELKGLIRAADMLVFAMPVYYYGWPSQAKVIVDRFYSFTGELSSARKKTALLAVAWDSTDVFEETVAYYRRLCRYMHFEDCGTITGGGCGTPSMTRATEYPKRAYELGRSL